MFHSIAGFVFVLALSLVHAGAAEAEAGLGLGLEANSTTQKNCTERAIDRCNDECNKEFPHDSDSEEVHSGWERCSRKCDRGCDMHMDSSEYSLLHIASVAFLGFFACTGTGSISGTLTRNKFEKEKRKHYRENGEKTQGIVVSKTTRTVSAGDNGARTAYDVDVDVQTEVNGQQLRATKAFSDIEAGIYNSASQGGMSR